GAGRPATASSHPSEYHAHETPAALRRSPIVGKVCGGTRSASGVPFSNGGLNGCRWSTAQPSGETDPPFLRSTMRPLASSTGSATSFAGAFGKRAVHAHTSHI